SPWRLAGDGLGDELDAIGIAGERSEEHTSELQSRLHLVCRLLLEKKKSSHPRRPGHRSSLRHRRRVRPASHARAGPRAGLFFFNDPATTEIYTLSLHDALPIFGESLWCPAGARIGSDTACWPGSR